MNNMSLSHLYRRLMSSREQPLVDAQELASVLDADSYASVAVERRDAVAAALSTSPGQADLARMLKALEPASAALAEGVEKSRRSAHPQRLRSARPAAGARRGLAHPLRWAGGIAACLAVTLGLSLWHVEKGQHERNHIASFEQSVHPPAAAADRIFTSEDVIFASMDKAHHRPSQHPSDELFRGSFAVGG